MPDKSISHDDALRSLFAEQPDFAMAYVRELRNQMYKLEDKAEELRCVISDLQDQASELEAENGRLKRVIHMLENRVRELKGQPIPMEPRTPVCDALCRPRHDVKEVGEWNSGSPAPSN